MTPAPAPGWRQRIILVYLASLRPAWAALDLAKRKRGEAVKGRRLSFVTILAHS